MKSFQIADMNSSEVRLFILSILLSSFLALIIIVLAFATRVVHSYISSQSDDLEPTTLESPTGMILISPVLIFVVLLMTMAALLIIFREQITRLIFNLFQRVIPFKIVSEPEKKVRIYERIGLGLFLFAIIINMIYAIGAVLEILFYISLDLYYYFVGNTLPIFFLSPFLGLLGIRLIMHNTNNRRGWRCFALIYTFISLVCIFFILIFIFTGGSEGW